jgi:hypothetical protein
MFLAFNVFYSKHLNQISNLIEFSKVCIRHTTQIPFRQMIARPKRFQIHRKVLINPITGRFLQITPITTSPLDLKISGANPLESAQQKPIV